MVMLQAYNTFSALRRVANFAGPQEQEACFALFHPYFKEYFSSVTFVNNNIQF
jgi:hypothetical protein